VSHEDDVFTRTFLGVLIFLFALMIVLIIGANMIAGDDNETSSATAETPESIKPVGQVKLAKMDKAASATSAPDKSPAPATDAGSVNGSQVYNTACMACHGTGAAGAPKMGDKANWSARIDKGMDTLLDHALNGFKGSAGYMPPKGGRADLSVAQVKAAIEHMVSNSK
jgi:cytochrome c5